MKSFVTITVVVILMMLVSFDTIFPQAGPKERPVERQSRNPFLLPSGVHPLSKERAEPVQREKPTEPATQLLESEPPPFNVRAILISDQIRLATIGPYIVAVGDKLHDETILEIKKDHVILGKGDKKRTLFLKQSPFHLTIEEKQ